MKNNILYVVLMSLAAVSSVSSAQDGYGSLPNAHDRRKTNSGYVDFPGFDRIHLVKEGDGTPERFAQSIRDQGLSRLILTGQFQSLQVRDLMLHVPAIRAGLAGTEQVYHFPFMVSVKHTQKSDAWINIDQGTIEVEGEITVFWDGSKLRVEVSKFDDSQFAEQFGRQWLGANSDINLDFARKVVVPVIEDYFNLNTEAMRLLLTFAPSQPAKRRP